LDFSRTWHSLSLHTFALEQSLALRMAMRYTHAMEDAKCQAVEAIAVESKRNAGETPAIPVSRDPSVTNEKPAASQIAVSG